MSRPTSIDLYRPVSCGCYGMVISLCCYCGFPWSSNIVTMSTGIGPYIGAEFV